MVTPKKKIKKTPAQRKERAKVARAKRAKNGQNVIRERVRHIQTLMSLNKWLGWLSVQALAKEWELAEQTVKNYATMASASLRIQIEESQDIRVQIKVALDMALAKAFEKGDLRIINSIVQTMIGAAPLLPDAKDTNAELVRRETERLLKLTAEESKAKDDTRTLNIICPPDDDD